MKFKKNNNINNQYVAQINEENVLEKPIFGNYEYFAKLDLIFKPELIFFSNVKLDTIEHYVDNIMAAFSIVNIDSDSLNNQISIFEELDTQLRIIAEHFESQIQQQEIERDNESAYYLKIELSQDIMADKQTLWRIYGIVKKIDSYIEVMETGRTYGGR